MKFVAKKLYYKIGEVCEIIGVDAHVLRYWETEFPQLAPPKNKGGQRTYRPRDIETLLQIRKLLYDERFTIAGARKKLSVTAPRTPSASPPSKPDPERKPQRPSPPAAPAAPGTQRLQQVRKELENILTLLERG